MLEKSTCSVPECATIEWARGWCRFHYQRWYVHGDPMKATVIVRDDDRRFWSHVDKSGDCWLWTGSTGKSGYGQFSINRRSVVASRASWMFAFGEIPDGMFVCHHCDNPPCVRIDHLFLGTVLDNAADAVSKGRYATGERQGASILTDESVHEMRHLYASGGYTQKALAAKFGTHQTNVSLIVNGKHWRHVS